MARKKYISIKKRSESLAKRVTHLENEVLRELGDIGDIARQFIDLKTYVKSELSKIRKDVGILKRQVKSKGVKKHGKSNHRK